MDKTRETSAVARNPLSLFLGLMQMLLILLVLPGTGLAASVVLDWDPSTDADLAGYKVYYQANSSSLPFTGTGSAEGSAPIDERDVTSATISGLDPGNSYFFAVTAYNSAGMESVYSNIIEIKESVAPAIAVTSPSNNASVSGIVSIKANASDNVGVSNVQFFINGRPIAETATFPYAFSWDTSSLIHGDYTVSAKAFDAAGNEAISDNVAVTVAGDTMPPTVSLAAPTNNATASGSVIISASANDNVGVTKVEIRVDNAVVLAANQSSVSYNWNTASESNGSHVLSAKAFDAAGNEGRSTDTTVTVFNDAIAPTLSISPVSTPSTVTAQTISGSASDNAAVASVTVQVGSGIMAAAAVSGNSWSFPLTGLAIGSNLITVRATDGAGNGSTATTSIVVLDPSTSTTAPLTLLDAQLALQIASGKSTPTTEQMAQLDVAPHINGKSYPNGKVDTGDVIIILLKLVGEI